VLDSSRFSLGNRDLAPPPGWPIGISLLPRGNVTSFSSASSDINLLPQIAFPSRDAGDKKFNSRRVAATFFEMNASAKPGRILSGELPLNAG
jgi:hypothetical protein